MSKTLGWGFLADVLLLALLVAVLIDPRIGHCDPVNLHMRSPSHCLTTGGSKIDLPTGYFLDEPTHDRLDEEVKRLQTVETRLTAENKTLRADVTGWEPGWYSLGAAIVVGLAAGYYLHKEL